MGAGRGRPARWTQWQTPIVILPAIILVLSGPVDSQDGSVVVVEKPGELAQTQREWMGSPLEVPTAHEDGRTLGPSALTGDTNAAVVVNEVVVTGSSPDIAEVVSLVVRVDPEPRSGMLAVLGEDSVPRMGEPAATAPGRPCDPAFEGVVSALLMQLQTSFSADVTANYLNLMLPLQSAMAALSRILLVNGSDQPLLEFIFQQVTQIDGDTADVSLAMNSRGLFPSEAACLPDAVFCEGGFGCGECSLEAPLAFMESLSHLSYLTVCSTQPDRPQDINGDFACLFELMLTTLSELSQAYLEVDLDGFEVDHIALDAIELADESSAVLTEWKSQRGLVCSTPPA